MEIARLWQDQVNRVRAYSYTKKLSALKLFSLRESRLSLVIRVRYEGGVLKPLDNVEFREGEEFEVIVIRKSFRGFTEKASKYRVTVDRDIVEEFMKERR